MIRKCLTLVCSLALFAAFSGCAENEHKITEKKESKTESTPQDTSPGEMVVE
jgi:hypothetical protein